MKRKKLLIDEMKDIEKIWKLVKELKKAIEKVERDVTFKRKNKEIKKEHMSFSTEMLKNRAYLELRWGK